jgi:hypothetical protein
MSLVITVRPDWDDVLQRNFAFLFDGDRPFDPGRARLMYAKKEWVGREFFDGPGIGQKRGMVWRTTDEKTEFPVIEYNICNYRPPQGAAFGHTEETGGADAI